MTTNKLYHAAICNIYLIKKRSGQNPPTANNYHLMGYSWYTKMWWAGQHYEKLVHVKLRMQ